MLKKLFQQILERTGRFQLIQKYSNSGIVSRRVFPVTMSAPNPIHRVLPDCSLPLVFAGDYAEAPYGMAGTGFFARHNSGAYFITASHCLGQTEEQIQSSVNNLCLPLSSSTYDLFPLRMWGQARAADSSSYHVLQGGHFDLVVISIDQSDEKVVHAVAQRSITLPPDGRWFENLERDLSTKLRDMKDKVLVEIRGFPRSGTESAIDYEAQHIITQGVVLRGQVRWESAYPHTRAISFLPEHCPISNFDGISGSPVFVVLKNDHGLSYALAGMMIRAAEMKGHFITVRWLVKAINAAIHRR